MTENQRTIGRRQRLVTGLVVVVASLVVAAFVAGVGFAGGSITAAQYQYGKTTICHHTHSKKHPSVTIKVAASAVAAHKRHGDTEGPCDPAAAAHGKKGHDKGSHGKQKSDDDQKTTTTSSTSTSQPTSSHGNSGEHGNSGDAGHGKKK